MLASRFAWLLCGLGMGCVGPGAEPPPREPPPENATIDVNVVMMTHAVMVYAHDPSLTCDCQDGTFADVGVCASSSDVPVCNCPGDFPISSAPCLDALFITRTNSDPPRTWELFGGSVAYALMTVEGLNPAVDVLVLTVSGCGGDVELALPRLPERAPRIVGATREADGVRLALADDIGRILGDGGGFGGNACGAVPSAELFVPDEWTQRDFGFGYAVPIQLATTPDSALGRVRVWHRFEAINRVVSVTAIGDGTLSVPLLDASPYVELVEGGDEAHPRLAVVELRANADGEIVALDAQVTQPDPEAPARLAVSALRLRLGDDDVVELDLVGGTTFRGALLQRTRIGAVNDLEGFHVDIQEPIEFVDVAGVEAPLRMTTFELHHLTRDVFVTGLQ